MYDDYLLLKRWVAISNPSMNFLCAIITFSCGWVKSLFLLCHRSVIFDKVRKTFFFQQLPLSLWICMWIKSWITRDNLVCSVDKQGITLRYVMLPQGSSTPTFQTYPHIHITLKYS